MGYKAICDNCKGNGYIYVTDTKGNKQNRISSVGCVNLKARSIGLKLRLMILFTTLIIVSGCTEFALLMSGSSIAISQNAYVKAI